MPKFDSRQPQTHTTHTTHTTQAIQRLKKSCSKCSGCFAEQFSWKFDILKKLQLNELGP